MALFGKPKKKPFSSDTPIDVSWVRSPKRAFYNFLNLEPEEMGLKGVSAVYVIWHGGLRPEWLYVGHTNDLAATFEVHRADDDIRDFENMGGLYATWAEIRPEYQVGVCKYLIQVMNPMVDNPEEFDEDEPPIAVFPPGVSRPHP